jgi:tetratricopeptide (TPR) repeat protein
MIGRAGRYLFVAGLFVMLSCAAVLAESIEELTAEFNSSFRNSDYAAALASAEKALAAGEAQYGQEDPKLADLLFNLAMAKAASGDRAAAEPVYKRAIAIIEKAHGPDDPRCAAVTHRLGKLYFEEGKYEDAEANYSKALAIYKKKSGTDAYILAVLTNDIADMYYNQGKFTDAEVYYKEAIDYYGRSKGNEQQVCDGLDKLYQIYFVKKDYKSAEEMCTKGLRVCMAAEDKKSLYYSNVLARMAEIYAIEGQYGKAIPRYKEAIDINKKIVGDDHPRVVGLMEKLSKVYKDAGRQSEARSIDKQIEAIKTAR